MFPWSKVFSGLSDWSAMNQVFSFVSSILAWDVIKYSLAALSGMVLIGLLAARVRRMGGN